MLNVVVPLAGAGKRFREAGYELPKPLIPIGDTFMIELALRTLARIGMQHQYFFIVQERDLNQVLKEFLVERGCVIGLEELSPGAVNSTLAAAEFIDNDKPLLIMNCDQYIDFSFNDFYQASFGWDASVVSFTSKNPHHSYLEVVEEEVLNVAEKEVLSNIACAGIYFYQKGQDYVSAARSMINKNIRTNGEFYITPVFNELILSGKRVTWFPVNNEDVFMFGTPEELRRANVRLSMRKEAK